VPQEFAAITTISLSPNGDTTNRLAAPPRRLLVATLAGITLVERPAISEPWQVSGRVLEGSHIGAIARDDVRGGLFAGAHSGGLYVSEDDGHTWERRTDGLGLEHVFSVTVTKTRLGVAVYAGTEPVSLFRSFDYGKSWKELPAIHEVPGMDKWTFPPPPHIAHTKALAFDSRNSDVIYACIEQGALLKTTDGGNSWRELASYWRPDDFWYRDIHRVTPVPSNPDELFMTAGMGLYHSLDGGEAWEKLTGMDFRLGYPDQFVISPEDENVLFMAGATHDPTHWHISHEAAGTVMVSRDRGRSWSIAGDGLPVSKRPNVEAMCLAAWPGGYSLFIGNTDGEIHCSEDGAKTWQLVASGLAPVSKVGHYRNLQAAAPAA
jgi:photosystem II stability/assembly factor-like uncharacterized protein